MIGDTFVSHQQLLSSQSNHWRPHCLARPRSWTEDPLIFSTTSTGMGKAKPWWTSFCRSRSICSSNGDSVEFTGLLDTCGSLNTGLDKFHFYIASKYLDLVDDIRHFNASDPFEPVKLEGAVTNPDSLDASVI